MALTRETRGRVGLIERLLPLGWHVLQSYNFVNFKSNTCIISKQTKLTKIIILLYLKNQGQITHNLCLDTHIHAQFQRVRSFSFAVWFPRAKTPKVCWVINVLSLDILSIAGQYCSHPRSGTEPCSRVYGPQRDPSPSLGGAWIVSPAFYRRPPPPLLTWRFSCCLAPPPFGVYPSLYLTI